MKRNVYDKYLGEYMHDFFRLDSLMEATINVKKYVNVLDGVLQDNKESILSCTYSEELVELLNNIFFKYKIIFKILDKSGEVLKGKQNEAVITIYFGFDIMDSILDNDTFTRFRHRLLPLLGHELVHRGQYYIRTSDFINFYAYEKEIDSIEYYKRPQEVMAYAWMAIENMRYNGISDNRILEKIKRKDLLYAEIGIAFLYLDKMKEKDFSTYKLFIKYIYMYLKNPIKYDLKILV